MDTEIKIGDREGICVLPYYALKGRLPFIEYIHGNPPQRGRTGQYVVRDGNDLKYCSRIIIGEEELSIRSEYRRLTDMEVVSSPHDIDGGRDMETLYELCRDWLKTVVAFGSEVELTVVASYAVMTWFVWRYDSVPYLRFIGDYGTGKTTALRALSAICYRSLNVSGAVTPPALFRIVNGVQGTLIIDEADLKGSGLESQIIKILNHGYTRGVAVIRLDRESRPEAFQTFGAKVIATREEFKDMALESRCLDIKMTPRRVSELWALSEAEVAERAEAITSGLLYWRLKHARPEGRWGVFPGGDAGSPAGYEARVQQLAAPLFTCTPGSRRREIQQYFEGVNLGYMETRNNGPEAQVRRILRKELNALNHRLTLAQLYGQLTYKCRVKNSSKKISRIAEVVGCEKRHGRDGVVFWFREGMV